VPSDKRARQRALRQQKRSEIDRAKRKRQRVRRTLSFGLIAVVIVVAVVLIAQSGSTRAKPAAKPSTTTTTKPSTTTTEPTPTTVPSHYGTPLPCPPDSGAAKRIVTFPAPPPSCIDANDTYLARVVTTAGTFTITMDPKASLAAVNNFVYLSRYRFYDGVVFQRVIPGFVVQGGSPNGTDYGGPDYEWTGTTPPKSCEKANDCYATGDVVMANSSGPSTNGSQFFIVLPGGAATLNTEPNYTYVGRVTSGMSVVDKIGAGGTSGGTPKIEYKMTTVTISQIPG
jgi:peptidyl-prolyl cis-trans isomerase B (cyclophilin B)